MRLVRLIESFRHSLTKRPEIFDAESLRVLSKLERLTLEWVRRETKTKGNRFVDTPCEEWMKAWQHSCNAYGSFSRKVEFELAYEELRRDKPGDDPPNDTETSTLLKASDAAAKAFMDGKQWCTADFALNRYGIKPQQLNRASTQEKGFKGIIVTRKKAQVGERKRGRMLVYHAGDLQRLANALDGEE